MTSSQLFLMLAEDLNFSRTAKKAYITQQCLSDHIKRMEQKYGTQLFYRRPKIMLTPTGRAVQRTLRQIKIVEGALVDEIREIENGAQGNIRLGINTTRARILFAEVFKQFHELCPDVSIDIVLNDTQHMENMLLKGQLDFFVGVNTTSNPEFKMIPLFNENIYLLISEALLKAYLPADLDYREYFTSGVDLALFKDVPFIRNLPQSTMTLLIDQYLTQHNIKIKNIISISDYDVQIELCLSGQVAAFCPTMILQRVFTQKCINDHDHCLWIFPIKNMTSTLSTNIICNASVHYPRYTKTFFDLLQQEITAIGQLSSRRGEPPLRIPFSA